jgi:excisionase family DNA binding protein
MEAIIEKTTKKDQQIARFLIDEMHEISEEIFGTRNKSIAISIDNKKKKLEIPAKAFKLLYAILDNMADGKSITMLSSDAEISTQQAADLLNVSRPHVISLLNRGDIPFIKVGSHRRILLNDIIAYDKRLQKSRNSKLNFLAKQAQELNMGY